MSIPFSHFAAAVKAETAFDVLAVARRLKVEGKDVIELEIGDSPFPSSPSAVEAGIEAIRNDQCHYGPSAGLPEFREAAAAYVREEYDLDVTADHVVAGPGAKNFEQLFCEAFVDPGDGVLVFSPRFPTYEPNIARRGARMATAPLLESRQFRPDPEDVQRFLQKDPRPKAVFLNSPHNPTGGVATHDDIRQIVELVRESGVALFSDEPYDRMVWQGQHHSPLAEPGMLDRGIAAYTFSKSFSMSGWRLGFAVTSPRVAAMLAKLTNTSLSCVPPFVQLAGIAALSNDRTERDRRMADFRRKVELLVAQLNTLDDVHCLMPGGSFYVFPSVKAICHRFHITSHGLAMYLLEAADPVLGVACLGGECFGEAGGGFLRLSTAEPDARLQAAVDFMRVAFTRQDRILRFRDDHPEHSLTATYGA